MQRTGQLRGQQGRRGEGPGQAGRAAAGLGGFHQPTLHRDRFASPRLQSANSPPSQPAQRPSQPPTPPACTAPLPAPAGFARPLVGTVPRPGCPPATQQHHCSRRCPWWCKQQAGSWPDPPGSFTFSSREMRSVRQSVRPDLLRGPPALPPPPPTPCSDPLEPCGSSSPTPVPARGLRTRLPGSSHAGSGVAGNLTPSRGLRGRDSCIRLAHVATRPASLSSPGSRGQAVTHSFRADSSGLGPHQLHSKHLFTENLGLESRGR